MIKLFRNIRKTLLEKGKTTSYLKYAIGEIVLIVIGILKTRPVRDEIWVETNKNEPIQRAFGHAI
jgi:hypothetical protein